MTEKETLEFELANLEYNSSVRSIKHHLACASLHTKLLHSSNDTLYKLEQKHGIKREFKK